MIETPQKPFSIHRFAQHHATEVAIAALAVILYGPLLIHWCDGWLTKSISIEHEYFSHGLIGLPFAGYLAWIKRNKWQALPSHGHLVGGVLLITGMLLYLSPMVDLINLSLPITLTGLCLWLKGLKGVRLMVFPLLLVFLATPNEIPYLIAPYTLPLQKFIAGVAGFLLWQMGMDVTVEQIYIYVNDRIVEVAPYCAGLKMLFTSLYAGMMLTYWTELWKQREKVVAFFVGIIALSVIANIMRNTVLTFFHGTGRDAAFAWFHEGWGGDVYSALLLGSLIILVHQLDRPPSPQQDSAP
ncbi:MAG: cyanoexosortase B [Cyanobacteria bacterium J06627_8]